MRKIRSLEWLLTRGFICTECKDRSNKQKKELQDSLLAHKSEEFHLFCRRFKHQTRRDLLPLPLRLGSSLSFGILVLKEVYYQAIVSISISYFRAQAANRSMNQVLFWKGLKLA